MQRDLSSFFGTPVKRKRSETESQTPTPKKKFDIKYDTSRVVKSEWFKLFPWLIHDRDENVFRCDMCRKTGKRNIFVTGKDCIKPKKDDFKKHEKSNDHKLASQAGERQTEMRKASSNAYSHQKDTVTAIMKTVLIMAQEDIPNSKMACFLDIQIENGSPSLKCLLKEDGSLSYSHHEVVDDIQRCLYTVVERDLLDAIIEAGYYAIEIDEATDSSNKSVLVVFTRFIGRDGTPESHFLGVEEMSSATADSVTSCLKDLLQKKGLDVKKMVGFASDGASVMRGRVNGVSTQLKKMNPYLITNHCMAHRLQLAAEKAANQVPMIIKYISTLNVFAKSLKFSPKLTRTLEASKEIHNEKANKIKQAFFTRWLSLADSTQALSGCIPSVISALYEAGGERAAEGRALLHGITKDMATYKFIHLTHFLADAVGLLAILSRTLQVANPTHQYIKEQIENCTTALEALKYMKGPHLEKLREFPTEAPESGITDWGTHEIKDSKKLRDQFTTASQDFLDQVTTRLSTMLPDSDIMTGFDMFEPRLTNVDSDTCLKKLTDMYGTPTADHQAVIQPEEIQHEWALTKNQLHNFNNMEHFFKSFLIPHRLAYPNLHVLVKIGLTIPTTSVNCERGISRYNAIKTDSRSSLRVEVVNRLMALSIEAPPYKEFRYTPAFEDWCLSKSRRLPTKLFEKGTVRSIDGHIDLK